MKNRFPVCVVVYLTDFCSLKCKHCFLTQTNCLNKNKIDYLILKDTIKTLKNNNVFMIAFTGGDPLLYPELFNILDYTSELGMMPLLGISGINVTKDISKRIYKSGVRCVQIGLNGSNRDVNDFYRGHGSFDNSMDSIKNLQDANVNVNLSFCLDKNNLFDLKNMLDFAYKNNIYKVKIEFWNELNSANNKLTKLDKEDKQHVIDTCELFMNINNNNDWIQYPKISSNLGKIHSKALIIMPNGDVKSTETGVSLGNIYKENIELIVGGVNNGK